MNQYEAYKSTMLVRFDDKKTAYYFSEKDFPDLNKEEYSFYSSSGNKLKGYFYFYDNPIKDRLIVFDHGIGGGHSSYMREIEILCKNGFKVFAYDHSGCMESEGENAGGLSRSLTDLSDCLGSLEKDITCISVIGHSWGGFSAMNISHFFPGLKSIVSLSGFVSVEKMIETYFDADEKNMKKIMEAEKKNNPSVYNFNSAESLENSEIPTLLIYSDNDPVCNITHYEILKNRLSFKNNISFILEKEKFHNPNYTKDAVLYLNEYYNALATAKLETVQDKEKFVSSFDWRRMTAQDEELWNKIVNFFI